jgi:hypothetical protein
LHHSGPKGLPNLLNMSHSKYLVDIEFRYSCPDYWNHSVTIGVYDTFEEACVHGNKLLETLEARFPLHVFPSGKKAEKERFSVNGGCFNNKKSLVSNLAYLTTPFAFYAGIRTLKFTDVNETIDDILDKINKKC